MSKVMTAREAIDMVEDGMSFAISGFGTFGLPEDLLYTLEQKFLETGSPKDLSLFYAGAPGAREKHGGNHLGHRGLLRRIHGGHLDLNRKLAALCSENALPVFMVPQDVNVHLLRAIANHAPGTLTRIGLKTYADPRIDGCRANQAAWDCKEEVVQLLEIDGEEYLLYKSFPIDICFIKGTTADEDGNITLESEATLNAVFELAAATHNSGGKVICQVDRLAANGSLNAKEVKVPGLLVDAVVVGAPERSLQSYAIPYNPALSAELKVPDNTEKKAEPLSPKKVIARRGAMEIAKNSFVNFGIGVPQLIASVLDEEGMSDKVITSVESGVIGGVPSGGLGMGSAVNPVAIIKHPEMFDLYHGGALAAAFLGAAEFDEKGNVNVTKFNGKSVGPGGFLGISQPTPKVCFCGTFTAGKSQIEIKDGKLNIIQDGDVIKFKKNVEQITFSGDYAREMGQEVFFLTERAVLKIAEGGVMVTEIAPGVDLEKDIIAHMGFVPLVAEDLKIMDERIFRPEKMGLELL
ncbi:acyl CoA:acetate/3-ketoacid CoA transferase [Frisingicoccus sp.]|uniref:acyl CoA:acetate/3-ketoacid CoA transferase n=1 Tax=Frisingicoccus sp. TaxID=1918627 RepID=UPI00399BF53B